MFDLNDKSTLNTISDSWNFNIDVDPGQLEKDLISFMITNNGIGLAANQIGIAKRVFVIGAYNHPEMDTPLAVFNPEIIEYGENISNYNEGCLSFPGLYLNIKRPEEIKVKFQTSDGTNVEKIYKGLMARCFQHEYDHLNGVCFVDKVSKLKLQLAKKRIRKLTK